jgi:hypothetical protein
MDELIADLGLRDCRCVDGTGPGQGVHGLNDASVGNQPVARVVIGRERCLNE